MKSLLSGFLLSFILVLFVPTILILISWNAVPGKATYGLKIGLEKVLLGVTYSDDLKTTLQIKYTKRRFDEVEEVIDKSNEIAYVNESLNNLTEQIISSTNSLQQIQSVTTKEIQTENLITTLETISQKIEEKKENSTANHTQVSTNTPAPTNIPTKAPTKIPTKIPTNNINIVNTINSATLTPTQVILSPSPSLSPTPTPVSNNSTNLTPKLEETQEKINETIKELKQSILKSNNSQKDQNNSNRKDLPDKDSNKDKQPSNRRN